MTIMYVDTISGDDSGGDGSYSNPYLTVGKADDTLSGGDEIRVALTTMNTLSGTLTFTEGSTSITTSADLTGTISAEDVVGKYENAEGWWRVASITSSTITLHLAYYGSSETTTGYHMAQPASSRQILNRAGTSKTSRLKCSGGWDLSTQTQTGLTHLYYSGTSYAFGTGTYDYLEISHFVCQIDYDFNYPLNMGASTGSYYHHLYSVGDADTGGGQLSSLKECELEYLVSNGAGDNQGIYLFSGGYLNTLTNCHSYSASSSGFDDGNDYNTYIDCSAKGCAYGWYIQGGTGTYIENPTVVSCPTAFYGINGNAQGTFVNNASITTATYGFRANTSNGTLFIIKDPTFSAVTTNYYLSTTSNYSDPQVILSNSGVESSFNDYWTMTEDTTDARSGTCIKYTPVSATFYANKKITLGTIKVASTANDIVLSVYMKDDASFNGSVTVFAFQDYVKVADYTEKTMTTSYAEQTLTIDSADLVNGTYLTLYAIITGTAGNVFIDDFSYSQA